MTRVYIETYGCQMNVADTELMLGVLGARRLRAASISPDGADVMLVNTCAVRDNAEQRVIGRVGELQRYKRPGRVLGVVGCMAQRLGPTLLERVPRWTSWPAPTPIAISRRWWRAAAAAQRVVRYRVPVAGSTTRTFPPVRGNARRRAS